MEVLMWRFAGLLFILIVGSTPVVADVLSQFLLPGRQCAHSLSPDANGRIYASIDDQGASSVMLFNPDLTVRFNRRFSSSGGNSPSAIAATMDGGSVVAGTIALPSGDTDAILTKVQANGNIAWKRIFGTPESDGLHSVTVLPDGSIAVVGHRISSSTSQDLLVARFSKAGAMLWKKVVGTPALDHAVSIAVTHESELMISAGTGTAPTLPLWIRFSMTGSVLSAQVGSTQEFIGVFYLENPQGGYYLGSVGPSVVGQPSPTNISRIDPTGRIVWTKSFGLAGTSLTAFTGFVNTDGSMVLAGNAFMTGALRGVLLKISSAGTVQWKRVLNFVQSTLSGAVRHSDGNIFAAGCNGMNTDSEDVITLSLPLSGNTGGCSRLSPIPISATGTSMTLRNFSILLLPASFRNQAAAIQSVTAQSTKSALCP